MADRQYLVLARKWRPQTFDEVVGQEHITRTLQNAIEAGRVGHAFLFIGSRGIGKTTTARILAKALNCLAADGPTPHPCCRCENCVSIAAGSNIDVIEIDGASNNSVDDVRQIRENIRLVPSQSRFKVYVVDEVHQLSASAFNALLKTLEEPPAHAVFVLATTEAHKVPATIISRCQRYDFRRVGLGAISRLLRRILDEEGVACTDEALYAIARAADGSIRDAESILEQVISYAGKEIAYEDVFQVLGLVDWSTLHSLCDALIHKDIGKQLRLVEDIVVSGKDLSQFVEDILRYFRNLVVCKTADPKTLLALPEAEIATLRQHAEQFTLTTLLRLVEQFAELSKDFDSQLAQRIALESMLIRISMVAVELSVDTVLEKVMQLGAGGLAGEILPSLGSTGSRGQYPASAPQTGTGYDKEPEAGPISQPSGEAKLVVSEANLADFWPTVVNTGRSSSLNLGVWLAHAKPVRLDGDTLLLQFAPHQARSKQAIERPENRRAVEKALAAVTENVRAFRCELAGESENEASPSEAPPSAPGKRVTHEEVRTALADPHVAKVVEVFKGRIVDVKRPMRHPQASDPG